MQRFQRFFANHFPALTSRDYAIFWVGQFLSVIGTWMQNTTQPLLAYRLSLARGLDPDFPRNLSKTLTVD